MPKHAIRQQLLVRRKQLDSADCRRLSVQVQQRLIAADCFVGARVLALYSPINNEVRTDLLFSVARAKGMRVCYPRVKAQHLEFVAVDTPDDLIAGSFGVAEPQGKQEVCAGDIDLIVVPGVAFDRAGHRLGYGKGFYDRELARVAHRAQSVGLCFDFQLSRQLPREEHDWPVGFLVTEKEFIPCHTEVAGSP